MGQSNIPTVLVLITMALYLVFHRFVLPLHFGATALTDWGWLSWYTLAMIASSWGLIAVATVRAPTARARRALGALLFIVFFYFAREADFHRLFTTEHVTRIRFYTDGSMPVGERLVGGSLMLAFVGVLLYTGLRFARPVLRAIRARTPWAVALAAWATTLVGSQIADKLMRADYSGRVLEEGLEATAATLALVTVLHARANPSALPSVGQGNGAPGVGAASL